MANGGNLADAFRGEAAAEAAPPAARKWERPPSREGRKAVVVHLDPGGYRELRILGIDLDRPLQAMMIEAVDDFLVKHGRPACADGAPD